MKEFTVKQVIAVRKDLQMRKGKIAAQVAHASLASVLDEMEENLRIFGDNSMEEKRILFLKSDTPMFQWLHGSFAKIVVYVDSEEELRTLMEKGKKENIQVTPIIDAGNTEFHGVPTLTCAAFGPEYVEKLDKLTGHLKLI